ncbi:hypothetical protein [Candidatus Vesicomyidisocius sp. SY067_SCS001]|uniref:hypothetical protein n=1 Tax=Candidatus Vesicomyidisocius sp. SY067_SCS001 TaxID=2732590 RepID=UPI00168859AF|nr:hypothetical protein [Candidatus Vesicomyosocius sp. SY067_SCS001]
MGRRDKNKFEKWFSLTRHQRRRGAKYLSKHINVDFKHQKKQFIVDNGIIYTYGSPKNIEEHFNALKNEFSGQSKLCHTHAKLIVLIRREFETKKHFTIFENLWHEETKFLLKNLNTRWLLSAINTFTDCSNNDAIIGLSVACSCLLITIEIQESERFIINSQNNKDDKEKTDRLNNEERIMLFDGISTFKFGTSDTIRNMRWRIDKAAKINVAGKILLEVFKRLQKFDTIYKRAKNRHTRDKTGWW